MAAPTANPAHNFPITGGGLYDSQPLYQDGFERFSDQGTEATVGVCFLFTLGATILIICGDIFSEKLLLGSVSLSCSPLLSFSLVLFLS